MDDNKPEQEAAPSGPKVLNVKVSWEGAEPPEPVFIDQFHLQHIGDYYFLTFGQSVFPLVVEQGVAPINTPIRPVARFVLTERAFASVRAVIGRAK
jgi:hypothetical protein